MMTQPIRTFQDLTSETAPAGGNTESNLPPDERHLEMRARYARAELVTNRLGDAMLWLGRQWRNLVDGIRTHYQVRAAQAELFGMSDRELADIGLSRSEIPFAVRQTGYGVSPQIDGFAAQPVPANENLRRAA